MATRHTPTASPRPRITPVWRTWAYGGLAVAWFGASTFGPLDLPVTLVVVVLGLLVALSAEPDVLRPTRGVVATRRTCVLAMLIVGAFVPVAFGMNLLLGRIPIESGHAVFGTLAAACVVLPRLAETRDLQHPVLLGHRELILAVTAVVAAVRAYRAGELFLAVVGFGVIAPLVMAVRRFRSGVCSPRRLLRAAPALQAAGCWLFLGSLAAAGLSGTLFIWRIYAPDIFLVITGLFWLGLVASAVLVAFPRPRPSAATTALALLFSSALIGMLGASTGRPSDAVTIGLPFDDEWQVVNGGRSALVNNHATLAVQEHAIDFVRFVDGRTFRGDRSRLENFAGYGRPVLAVADGRVTEAVDSLPDLPVGGSTWHNMAGNHVVLDIGHEHYVLYGHLQQGSLHVRVGEPVHRGQVIGHVGDSGNSGEPHLHLQMQNRPTFDVEDRSLRTYPMLLEDSTVPAPHRGDTVGPAR